MGIFDELPQYEPRSTPIDQGLPLETIAEYQQQRANRSIPEFQNDITQNVRERSSLFTRDAQESPESSALSARAKQLHDSSVNQIIRRSEVPAIQRQTDLQTQDLSTQAAVYTNLQSRAHLNFLQISYQREAALMQEANRRELYAGLFGGIGAISGAFAARGLYNARHATPQEKVSPRPDQSNAQYFARMEEPAPYIPRSNELLRR